MSVQAKRGSSSVKKCDCPHKYQDEKHGKNMRVHNACGKQESRPSWRCTICGKVKD